MTYTVASEQGNLFNLPIAFKSVPVSLVSDTGAAVTRMSIYADKTAVRIWGKNPEWGGYVDNHKAFWISIGV